MLSAIQFDNQAMFRAEKISNETVDGDLTTKF